MVDLIGSAQIRVDMDTDDALRAIQGFTRGADGQLRDLRGRFVSESDLMRRSLVNGVVGDDALLALQGFTRDAAGQLRDARGRFVSESDLMRRALVNGVRGDDALAALRGFTRDANGQLRDLRGRFVDESGLMRRALGDSTRDSDRLGISLRSIGSVAGILGRTAGLIGLIGSAAGAAIPLVAGVVATLENIAPAAGVGATALVAVASAQAAVKIGLIGVADATKAAFDPSDPAKYAEALEKLSPNAQAFVGQLRAMQPAFDALRKSVQDRLFENLDTTLERTAKATVPALRKSLLDSAGTLNIMAQEVLNTASGLSQSGALGKALTSANAGLKSFSSLPSVIVQGLVQVAAAAGPSFERLSAAAGRALEGVSQRLSTSFASSAMEQAISTAIDLIKDLATVGRNVGQILSSIFSAAQVSGVGFIGTLKQITGGLATAFASPAAQSGLRALFQAMSTLAQVAVPLLGQALAVIAPVFTALGPPVSQLIFALGGLLRPIIQALGPVLSVLAATVGAVIEAISPLLPIVGQLVAALLPPLIPIFKAVTDIVRQAAPVVLLLAQTLAATLAPILAQLPAIVQPLVNVFTSLATMIFPILSQLIIAISPSLVQLGVAFGNLLAAVAPLLMVLVRLVSEALTALLPLLVPIISLVGVLASVFANQLAGVINNIVIPAFKLIAAILRGDLSGAWNALLSLMVGVVRQIVSTVNNFGQVVRAVVGTVVGILAQLPGRIFAALAPLAGGIVRIAASAFSRFVSAVVAGGSSAVSWLRGLPGRIVAAVGPTGSLLYGAGRNLVQGMINGLSSLAGSLAARARQMAASAVASAKSALGIGSPSKVFRKIGQDTGRGFIIGLTSTKAKIDQTADNIAKSITKAFSGRRTTVDDRLVAMVQRNNTRLQNLSVARDKIAQRIADAQKFAGEVSEKARGTGALSSLIQPDFFAPRMIESRLASAANRVRAFTNALITLRKQGLRKDLLGQLLEMGPQAGLDFARSLTAQGVAGVKRFNVLQERLSTEAARLGKVGADAMFDSGKKAGAGFLTGLKAQQKSIEALMLSIAKGMQKAIRRALGIRSPSAVMAEIGRQTTLGVAMGLVRPVPAVERAMGAVSNAIASGVITPRTPLQTSALAGLAAGRGALQGAGSPAVVHLTVENHGVLGSEQEVMDWLTKSIDTLNRQRRLPALGSA